MFKLPKKRADSAESAEDSVTYEGVSNNLALLKQAQSNTYCERNNVTVDLKNDENKSIKSEKALIANSTNGDQSFDLDDTKQPDEDVPLVFSMKQRRISKYNFKRDYKTSSALEEARPCTGDSESMPAKNSSSSDDEDNDDDQKFPQIIMRSNYISTRK